MDYGTNPANTDRLPHSDAARMAAVQSGSGLVSIPANTDRVPHSDAARMAAVQSGSGLVSIPANTDRVPHSDAARMAAVQSGRQHGAKAAARLPFTQTREAR